MPSGKDAAPAVTERVTFSVSLFPLMYVYEPTLLLTGMTPAMLDVRYPTKVGVKVSDGDDVKLVGNVTLTVGVPTNDTDTVPAEPPELPVERLDGFDGFSVNTPF